jgi:membrane-bound ClpP family serine protease
MKFGREPSLYIGAIGTILTLVAGYGLDFLSPDQAGLIIVVLNAALGVWNALKVRPVAPAAFTYFIGVVATLIATYGVELSQSQISDVNAVVLAVLAFILRGNVSPTATGGGVNEESVRARSGPSPY